MDFARAGMLRRLRLEENWRIDMKGKREKMKVEIKNCPEGDTRMPDIDDPYEDEEEEENK